MKLSSGSVQNGVVFSLQVSGLMKYQCKLCSFMDESCGKVRVHYVQSHPEQLPLLCGYCRERCDVSTFRSHHEQCHHQHPVKVRPECSAQK